MRKNWTSFRSKVFGVFMIERALFPPTPTNGDRFTSSVGDGQAEPIEVSFVYNGVWQLDEQ